MPKNRTREGDVVRAKGGSRLFDTGDSEGQVPVLTFTTVLLWPLQDAFPACCTGPSSYKSSQHRSLMATGGRIPGLLHRPIIAQVLLTPFSYGHCRKHSQPVPPAHHRTSPLGACARACVCIVCVCASVCVCVNVCVCVCVCVCTSMQRACVFACMRACVRARASVRACRVCV